MCISSQLYTSLTSEPKQLDWHDAQELAVDRQSMMLWTIAVRLERKKERKKERRRWGGRNEWLWRKWLGINTSVQFPEESCRENFLRQPGFTPISLLSSDLVLFHLYFLSTLLLPFNYFHYEWFYLHLVSIKSVIINIIIIIIIIITVGFCIWGSLGPICWETGAQGLSLWSMELVSIYSNAFFVAYCQGFLPSIPVHSP